MHSLLPVQLKRVHHLMLTVQPTVPHSIPRDVSSAHVQVSLVLYNIKLNVCLLWHSFRYFGVTQSVCKSDISKCQCKFDVTRV